MERKKLKLEELKVQSFITELAPGIAHTAKGGDDSTLVNCNTNTLWCPPDTGTVVITVANTYWPQCGTNPVTLGPGGPIPTLTPPFSSNLTVNF